MEQLNILWYIIKSPMLLQESEEEVDEGKESYQNDPNSVINDY